MSEEQVFCGAKKCSHKCPAYDGDDFSGIFCKIIKAKIMADEAKEEAYEKMKEYYSLKIEGDK